jgi:hypothetical protein
LPDELFQLKKLREVMLDNNAFSGPIPENIGQAKALGTL